MSDVDDLMKQLEGFGEKVDSIDLVLLEIGSDLVNQLRDRAPVDTGDLKRSLKAVVENNTLRIFMNYYGPFQAFGVVGRDEDRAVSVPFGISPRPLSEPKYKFQPIFEPVGGPLPYAARLSIRSRGLRATGWIDLEILKRRFIEKLSQTYTNL
jgi:hypothetical protein